MERVFVSINIIITIRLCAFMEIDTVSYFFFVNLHQFNYKIAFEQLIINYSSYFLQIR